MTIHEVRRETDVPVVIADSQGIITHVNERFETVFGWPAKEILGKSLATIIPPNLHDAHHLGFFPLSRDPKTDAAQSAAEAESRDEGRARV